MMTLRVEAYLPSFQKLEEELSFLTGLELDERTELKKIIAGWQAEVSGLALSAFRSWHVSRVPTFTGASLRSLRHFSGRTNRSYSGRWDAVGYFPIGAERMDTPITRSVEIYWGGREIQGVLSRPGGLAPGAIKLPRSGGGPGTFGGYGYSRVGLWASKRGLSIPPRVRKWEPGKRGRPPRSADTGNMKRLVLALVARWELNGMLPKGDPVLAFHSIMSNIMHSRLPVLISSIKNWWYSLGRRS